MFNARISPLAHPTTLPDYDRPYGLPAFNSVEDAIHSYDGDDAIYALYPKRIEAATQLFLDQFPGKVLYAVKANPHPAVLKILWASGLRGFDVASIREIDQVKTACPDAELYLMHPVKSRRTIQHAYANGVRHFAFDCASERLSNIIQLDCAVLPGNSGSPVLTQTSDGWSVTAIVSAMGRNGALAVPVSRLD